MVEAECIYARPDPVILRIEGMRVAAQTIADEAQSNFGFDKGDLTMLFMDMPEVPPQYTPIIVAQVSQTKQQNTDRTIGVCHPIENRLESRLSAVNGVAPVSEAMSYIEDFSHRKFSKAEYLSVYNAAKMTLLQAPTHGELRLYEQTQTGRYLSADYNYTGPDQATVLVEIGSYKVKVMYHFALMQNVPGSGEEGEATDDKSICPNGYMWKISATSDANGKLVVLSVDYLSPTTSATDTTATDTAALASTLGASFLSSLSADPSSVTFNLADLAGGAVGQATGPNITLDTNAAGNNWFIDTTPADNSEFLPTSNPYEWVAKEGSAAYGKMDMLSVLLHEYGHALGIDHSADGHDYMATTLTAGVRRMPSAEDLALMQQLVGEVKVEMASVSTQGSGNTPSQLPLLPLGGFGLAFLGRLRGSRHGSINIEADLSTLVTRFAVTANEKLTNGNFSVASGMPVDNGWATQGSVDFANGSATLKEVSTSQTRLNQVFVVNPRDRFLSFTIDGAVLKDPLPNPLPPAGEGTNVAQGAAQPLDAFEVALLDANTGLSLAGAISLTHTDAMLNLQADGTETAASSVTRVTNPDGSRTYRVDLSGIAVGTAVNLSFDLIGFGKDNSEVTIRDVRVSGLPELHDDAATMNEDGSLAFDPFAQVDNSALLQLGSHVVDVPAHGSVTVNTDGTFVYTPAADYFGSDSFSRGGFRDSGSGGGNILNIIN